MHSFLSIKIIIPMWDPVYIILTKTPAQVYRGASEGIESIQSPVTMYLICIISS